MANCFENAASRTDRELFECFNARDWPGIEALAAPDLVFDERRRMVRNTCGRDVWLEQFRVLFDVPSSRFRTQLLGTRGERLSLSLHQFTGEVAGGGGPLEMDDHLVLHEVDAEGRLVAIVLFDLEDEDAAWTELDARYEAGEGAAHPASCQLMRGFDRAVARRDWNAVAALCADSLIEYDHRSLAVLGTTRGADAWARNFSTLVDLSPDAVYRIDHFRAGARGCLSHGSWHGTREGGPYEMPLNAVLELDARGRIVRADIYDDDGVEAALARFAELTTPAGTALGRFENAASHVWRAVCDVWSARDLAGFEALHPRPLRYQDHRRLFQLDLDRSGFLDFTRPLLTMRVGRTSLELVATRGERLALMRSTMEMEDDSIGPSVIESLMMIEVDERGDIAAYDRWDSGG